MPAEKLRFHLDENVDADIATGLENFGINVTTTPKSKILGFSDFDQFDYCKKEGRVIITHDSDFLRLEKKDVDHYGIIYGAMNKFSIGEIILRVTEIYNEYSHDEM